MNLEPIRRLCRENSISLKALELACGLSNGVIAKWADRNPRVDSLKKVADYFGVTLDDLVRDTERTPF